MITSEAMPAPPPAHIGMSQINPITASKDFADPLGYTRTAPRNVPRPDSIAGIFATTSAMVWPRASRNRARHPHTSTVADMTSVPASPMALAISGQACSLRSIRIFARRRRCAHHGTDNITAPMTSACGSGVT
jgi:hypothetical protein